MFSPVSWIEAVLVTIQLAISVYINGLILTYPWRKKRAGTIILRLERTKQHRILVIIGVIILIGTLWIRLSDATWSFSDIVWGIFMSSVCGGLLFIGLTRIQITERGLFWIGLLKWEIIARYSWKGDMLTLVLKKRYWLQKEARLAILPYCKDSVNKVLDRKLQPTSP